MNQALEVSLGPFSFGAILDVMRDQIVETLKRRFVGTRFGDICGYTGVYTVLDVHARHHYASLICRFDYDDPRVPSMPDISVSLPVLHYELENENMVEL